MIYAQDIIDALKAELSTARAENEALRKRVGELETVLDYHQKQHRIAGERAEQAEAQLAESEASCDRLRSAYDDVRALNAQLAVNHSDIVTPLRVELAEVKLHMERAGMYGNAGRYWEGRWRDEHAGAAALQVQLAEAKSALSAEREDFESLATIHAENKARIASLEKSVTVLREALREIDNQNTRYGQPGPAARIARDALAQATDQPTTAEP